ncbi:MAG TPA: alpha/beta hydrolase fold domain-containing protein [Ferruginibacter sp.]|nr:alpha/beta hydrolase fold domain-containing protein [Ferruginibacter sp.]
MRFILSVALFVLMVTGCKKEENQTAAPTINLTFSTAPITVPTGVQFAADVSYNNSPNSKFDIFLPQSTAPTSLVIFIHGGGFVGGDKSEIYTNNPDNIQAYLQNNMAFATINYQFRTSNPDSGILLSLNDIKRCIQFIRYYASSFNIDKNKVACYGGSAGGGASIYLAFHPEMADNNNADPVLRESTRLTAAGHLTSQCSYDPVQMQNIFAAAGIDFFSIPGVATSLLSDFGLDSLNQLYTDPAIIAERHELDMLGWMSSDDPEFYVSNGNPNTTPTMRSEAIHHPLQAKALNDKATSIGLAHVTNIPSMGIYAVNNETISEFMIRKLTH